MLSTIQSLAIVVTSVVLVVGALYAEVAITQEWPAMAHDSLSPAAFRVTQQLWTTLLQSDVRSPTEQASLPQAIEALRRLSEHQRVRELQSRSRIPWILWAVLLVGALTTVVASCTFDARSLRLHAFQVTTLVTGDGLRARGDRGYRPPIRGQRPRGPDRIRVRPRHVRSGATAGALSADCVGAARGSQWGPGVCGMRPARVPSNVAHHHTHGALSCG